ncbi:MAG: hypothetical protein HY673_09480 [Chloroflexi bacterium]|nr:hypothetical protein [Chloroflexota bacterium]
MPTKTYPLKATAAAGAKGTDERLVDRAGIVSEIQIFFPQNCSQLVNVRLVRRREIARTPILPGLDETYLSLENVLARFGDLEIDVRRGDFFVLEAINATGAAVTVSAVVTLWWTAKRQ